MVVGGSLFTRIITLKKKKQPKTEHKPTKKPFWNPGGSFRFVAETLHYSTVLRREGSHVVVEPHFNGEDTGRFQARCTPKFSKPSLLLAVGNYSLQFLSTTFSDCFVLHSALGRASTPRNISWKDKIISPSFSSCAKGSSRHSLSVWLRESVMLRWADVTEWKSAKELQRARCGVTLV